MPRRIEDFRGLTQASRVKLLHAIQRVPGRKLQELADEVGIHINTAREHLHLLEEEGLIVSRLISTGTRGRPPVVFDPVQQPHVNPQADERTEQGQLKGDLLRRLYPSLDQTEVLGADAQHQIDALYLHLEDVGFEPELDSERMEIELLPCTHHELLDKHKEIVCSVHERLIQDQLKQVPGPVRMGELQAFITPHQCRLILQLEKQPADEYGAMPLRKDEAEIRRTNTEAPPAADLL